MQLPTHAQTSMAVKFNLPVANEVTRLMQLPTHAQTSMAV